MEFKSTKELNEAAARYRAEGDEKTLEEIARKYHIDEEDVEDFLDGADTLATPLTLALGTIEYAKKELKTKGVLADWMGILESMASDSEDLAEKITFSGLEIKDLLGKILKEAFDSKVQVDDRIAKAAGLRTPLYLGIPGNKEIKKLIEEFYA